LRRLRVPPLEGFFNNQGILFWSGSEIPPPSPFPPLLARKQQGVLQLSVLLYFFPLARVDSSRGAFRSPLSHHKWCCCLSPSSLSPSLTGPLDEMKAGFTLILLKHFHPPPRRLNVALGTSPIVPHPPLPFFIPVVRHYVKESSSPFFFCQRKRAVDCAKTPFFPLSPYPTPFRVRI